MTWAYLNLILPTRVILYPCVWFIKIGETSIINLKLSLHIKFFGAVAVCSLSIFEVKLVNKTKISSKTSKNQTTLFLLIQKARRTNILVRRTYSRNTQTAVLVTKYDALTSIRNDFLKNSQPFYKNPKRILFHCFLKSIFSVKITQPYLHLSTPNFSISLKYAAHYSVYSALICSENRICQFNLNLALYL